MSVQKQLQQALQLHQSGHVADAADLYAAVLRADPKNTDALNLLGSIFIESGQLDTGIQLCQEAVNTAPDFFVPYVNLGNGLQAAGRLEEAANAFQKAVDLNANSAIVYSNLGSALNALGRFDEAAEACEDAVKLEPGFVGAYTNLGNARQGLGDDEAALSAFQKAVELNQNDSDAQYNLGTLFKRLEHYDDALAALEIAVKLDPNHVDKLYNLGLTLGELSRYEEAEVHYQKCLAFAPDHEDALNNLSATLKELGRLDEAEDYIRQALTANPDNDELHWNLALVLLQQGRYEDGWAAYEHRWDAPGFTTPKRDFGKPAWNGDEAGDQTLLIHAEQGFGDAMLMARFVPWAAKRSQAVHVECRPGLERLFATLDGVASVTSYGDSLPTFDCHIAMMSLPHSFGLTLDTIPADVPYLNVPDGIEADPCIGEADGLKVGVVWAGNPTRIKDNERSCDPDLFRQLAEIDGVSLFNLQMGHGADGYSVLSELDNVFDVTPGLNDFADTAAQIDALDLVITVDTAVGHLAGALGKPVWGLHAANASYLWLQEREDTPWYPTMRLFRQTTRGDWAGVMEQVVQELKAFK
ncbi:tetratricopeptide repeat-containing glycosyltransferase family protein [Magnetovibrio sp. PR-2]|uniref:tetratricopeptide repeat-containing glycosyltransferase family protein n=1 Tax=Magnetovibrio sp. PR-2 TaxID=3120356 RepID=UPI002FCE67D8